MVKLNKLLFILIFSCFFLFGCSLSLSKNSLSQNNINDDYSINPANSTLGNIDLKICDNIQKENDFLTEMSKLECYNLIAIKTHNATPCKVHYRYNSEAVCIRTIAADSNDSSVCELDDMEKDVCYYAVAIKKSDSAICNNISENSFRNNCINDTTNHGNYFCYSYGC